MADYSQLKVPDLKKILQERGLAISGNKADLIARLTDADKKSGGAAAGEDEIDWDEDDNKATAAPVTTEVQIQDSTVSKVDADPAKATDATVKAGEAPKAADAATATTTEPAPAVEAPKQDFSIGIQQTDADKEAEKRAQRAKRFGISEDEEAKKLAERAKKFGLDAPAAIVKGLDSALPERRTKRGREDRERDGGRNAKRQTPDRRTEQKAPPVKAPIGRITDDPTEKAKAEARAKRFEKAT